MQTNKLVQVQDALALALQADLECGVAWMNDLASKEFGDKYPNLCHVIGNILDMEFEDEEE